MRIRDDASIRNDCLSQGGAIDFASRQKARMRVNRGLGLKETVFGHYIREIQIRLVESADCSDVFPITLKNRSEEHTSELQSRLHLVCRLLLEKKKKNE